MIFFKKSFGKFDYVYFWVFFTANLCTMCHHWNSRNLVSTKAKSHTTKSYCHISCIGMMKTILLTAKPNSYTALCGYESQGSSWQLDKKEVYICNLIVGGAGQVMHQIDLLQVWVSACTYCRSLHKRWSYQVLNFYRVQDEWFVMGMELSMAQKWHLMDSPLLCIK